MRISFMFGSLKGRGIPHRFILTGRESLRETGHVEVSKSEDVDKVTPVFLTTMYMFCKFINMSSETGLTYCNFE